MEKQITKSWKKWQKTYKYYEIRNRYIMTGPFVTTDYTPTQEVIQVQEQIFESMVIDVAGGIASDIERDETNERDGANSSELTIGGKLSWYS